MCKRRILSTLFCSLDAVPLLVFAMSLVSAHVVLPGLVVPDLAVVSTPVRPGHPQSRQHLHQWVVAHFHLFISLTSFVFPMVDLVSWSSVRPSWPPIPQ